MKTSEETPSEAPTLFFTDTAAWEAWIAEHYDFQPGIWMKLAKKASGIPCIARPDALDIALCYGWIDGQAKTIDEIYYLQKYTPRRAKSIWSKVNIGKVEKLIADGRMQPSGHAAIAAAKSDGRWDAAYDPPSTATPAADFLEALADYPEAKAYFDSLGRTNQYAFIWHLATAKKPETRTKRIGLMVEMLKEGKHF